MKKALEEVNKHMRDILEDGIFVINIKIDTIEFYHDEDIGKIKVRTKTTQNQNDKIFTNKKIQEALDSFLQELANEINEEFADSEELEDLINSAMDNNII